MSRNNKLISENLRTEIAKELGVYDQVKKDPGADLTKICGEDCLFHPQLQNEMLLLNYCFIELCNTLW